MPLKRYKTENKDELSIGQILYAKRFGLTVDRNLCKGCYICKLACPREAITLKPLPKGSDGKAKAPLVDIDENKCDYHAVCEVVCPFGAMEVKVNGEPKMPSVEKEAFPSLLRDIQVESEKCEPNCKICEEKCPLNAIKVTFEPLNAEQIAERKKKGLPSTSSRTIVDVEKKLCAACRVCEVECPAKAIKVNKFFEGSIVINDELCPEGCHDCLDVCPVNALYLEKGKVHENDMVCIYCGACVNVCPKPEALTVVRTSVRHTPIKSGAWNKTLERLTSTYGLIREIKAKRIAKSRDAFTKLVKTAKQ